MPPFWATCVCRKIDVVKRTSSEVIGGCALTPARRGHAALDLPSRNKKAEKIARLLGLSPGAKSRRMLEVGCGSGGISHWFGTAGVMGWDVTAVDVEDVRVVTEGFSFQ